MELQQPDKQFSPAETMKALQESRRLQGQIDLLAGTAVDVFMPGFIYQIPVESRKAAAATARRLRAMLCIAYSTMSDDLQLQ
ncbi:MAG TPA: hypothetical protein VGE13_01520 [Candidatus Saccharimonadales bacterium]